MQLERTGTHELTVRGNIKTTQDYLDIREHLTRMVDEGQREIRFRVLESLSMPSSVIGFLVKLVNKDKVQLELQVEDPRLLELLAELGLVQLFGARSL